MPRDQAKLDLQLRKRKNTVYGESLAGQASTKIIAGNGSTPSASTRLQNNGVYRMRRDTRRLGNFEDARCTRVARAPATSSSSLIHYSPAFARNRSFSKRGGSDGRDCNPLMPNSSPWRGKRSVKSTPKYFKGEARGR